MYRRLPIWLAFVALWTWAQLIPEPGEVIRRIFSVAAPTEGDAAERGLLGAILSPAFWNVAHIVAYATLTILSAWLRVPRRWRWALLVFLSLHGFVTEYLQGFVPTRYSTWADIGYNHIGILVGFLISHRWWLAPSEARRAS